MSGSWYERMWRVENGFCDLKCNPWDIFRFTVQQVCICSDRLLADCPYLSPNTMTPVDAFGLRVAIRPRESEEDTLTIVGVGHGNGSDTEDEDLVMLSPQADTDDECLRVHPRSPAASEAATAERLVPERQAARKDEDVVLLPPSPCSEKRHRCNRCTFLSKRNTSLRDHVMRVHHVEVTLFCCIATCAVSRQNQVP